MEFLLPFIAIDGYRKKLKAFYLFVVYCMNKPFGIRRNHPCVLKTIIRNPVIVLVFCGHVNVVWPISNRITLIKSSFYPVRSSAKVIIFRKIG